MFFEDLCLGRAWTIGVFTFVASPRTWAADGLFAIASLIVVSTGLLPNFLCKPFSVSWSRVRTLGVSEIETNTHLQFKHAFPRCNGVRGGGLDLELSGFIVRRLVRIFEWALKSWKPWSLCKIYTGCVRDVGSLLEGGWGRREKASQNRPLYTSLHISKLINPDPERTLRKVSLSGTWNLD